MSIRYTNQIYIRERWYLVTNRPRPEIFPGLPPVLRPSEQGVGGVWLRSNVLPRGSPAELRIAASAKPRQVEDQDK